MITYYLRFGSESEAQTALENIGWITEEGDRSPSPGFLWDPIGPITISEAVVDAIDVVLTAAVIDSRFHANVYSVGGGDLPEPLVPYSIPAPTSPRRILGV